MFIIGLHLFSYFTYYLGYWDKYPHLVGVTLPFPLLHGPMLFLYTAFSLRSDQKLRRYDYLHFLPFVLTYFYMFPFFFTYSAERKVLVNNGQVDDYLGFMYFSLTIFIISGIVYPIVSYRLVNKHHKMISENFSYDEYISLNWLKYCIWGIGVIYLSVLVFAILEQVIGLTFPFSSDLITYILVVLFVFFLGYFGIRHHGLFTEGSSVNRIIVEPKPQGEYKKSGLKQEVAETFHEKLLKLMNDKKPYLEPKLTLNNLAEELQVSINHLSQIINQFQEKNFYDFINEYRVEEFKNRVAKSENRNFSILAIAFDSGFNSKSSFNSVFKKHTGITPSEYMTESKTV